MKKKLINRLLVFQLEDYTNKMYRYSYEELITSFINCIDFYD